MTPELNTEAFKTESQLIIGIKIYIIERHFNGGRKLTEAINATILSAAKYEKPEHDTV